MIYNATIVSKNGTEEPVQILGFLMRKNKPWAVYLNTSNKDDAELCILPFDYFKDIEIPDTSKSE